MNNHNAPEAESRARLRQHIESLVRAETLIGPVLSWVGEQEDKGDATFTNAGLHGDECFRQLIELRTRLEAIHAGWCKHESGQEKAPSFEGA